MKKWAVKQKERILEIFQTKDEAIDYMIDLWFDGEENLKVTKILLNE